MTITEREIEDIIIVKVAGQIKSEYEMMFREKLDEIIQKDYKNIIINLEKVDFMNSSSLGALLDFLDKTKSKGVRLVLAELNPEIMKLLEITRLDKVFEIYDTEREAINAL